MAADPNPSPGQTVLVRLLDEGTTVYRPVWAARVTAGVYRLETRADYDPGDETWEFPPGSAVVCERRQVGGETAWTVVAAVIA